MIIKCDNCYKNFDIDSDLIPGNGRLLQCNACNHKWFFKKEIKEQSLPIIKFEDSADEPIPLKEDITKVEKETPKAIDLLDRTIDDIPARENNVPNIKISTNKKSYKILGLTIIFIISFIAIIIVLDTFQKPISIFVPNIEFILYNLYETINDIVLFFSDLI